VPVDPRSPCLVGVAQHTVRGGSSPEPLDLWEQVARAAAADAGIVLDQLDSMQVVYCQTWPYDDPVGRLAERIGADPKHRLYSGIGGTTPQLLLNDTAEAILRGEVDVALVVGAEALYTMRQAKKRGERLPWSFRDPEKKPFPFEAMPHPSEVAHEVFQAYLTFPLFDVARRAALGVSIEDYHRRIGELFEPMTEVAAANPHAWFPIRRSAEELATATPENRYVGWPYTKYEISVMDVDMASAAILVSAEAAERLGVPDDKRVYLRGWAYGTDCWYVAERPDFTTSVAMREVSQAALGAAGVGVDDLAHLDLYSCFASSVHLGIDALGIDADDKRGLTVTGGLPFSGGAGSNYMLHSVATMAEVLRADPSSYGLVSGVGMHMTKHCYAVYSTTPGPVAPPDTATLKATLKAVPKRTIAETYDGDATVVTYAVEHGRDGAAATGLLVLDLPDGARTYARVADPALLADAESRELVGQSVRVSHDGTRNIATW
jgi:acetyl-CoA C-acetyltransferase